MCLGIPMQIKSIDGFMASCEAKGVRRDVSLFMMQDEAFKVDDYVVVHVLSLIHISEPTRLKTRSRMPSSA